MELRMLGLLSYVTGSWQAALLSLLSIILAVPAITWANSLWQSRPVTPGTGRQPPIVPYWIPFVQHLYSFLNDPMDLYDSVRNRYGTNPASLLMMNIKFHVFSNPASALKVFQRAKDFTFEPVLGSLMENALNLPPSDRKWFFPPAKDSSKPTKLSDLQDPRVFIEWNINIWKKYLNGKSLTMLMDIYLKEFLITFSKVTSLASLEDGEWMNLDLHEAMGRSVFETSTMTFFGSRLGDIWGPTMWEDFKSFNDASYIGSRTDLIYRLVPRAGTARERMLVSLEKWCSTGIAEWEEEDQVWNDDWGCRLNLEKEVLARKLGFSLRGRAAVHASFLFASNLNAIPLATWATLAVVSSSKCLERFRAEASTCLLSHDQSSLHGEIQFNLDSLLKNDFVHAVWQETIRLGGNMGLARLVVRDTELDGYVLKAGSLVLLPVRLLHTDEDLFPEPHEFKPERWMVPPGLSETETEKHEVRIRRQQSLLRSFGGGASMCAGRWAAEKEVLGVVAAMVTLFDFDVKVGGAIIGKGDIKEDLKVNLNPRSLGIMDPAGKVSTRIRKRVITKAVA